MAAYPLAKDMLAAPKEELVGIIRSTARFGKAYALSRYAVSYTHQMCIRDRQAIDYYFLKTLRRMV